MLHDDHMQQSLDKSSLAVSSNGTGDRQSGHAKAIRRQRLVDAMLELAAQHGYLSTSVAELAAHAGMSTKTFYELFEDREDCLLAAYRSAATRVLGQIQPQPAQEQDWRTASRNVLDGLLQALQEDPAGGRVLLVEALAGGARVRTEREQVLERFEQRAQEILDATTQEGRALDLPATALIGAVRSLVSRYLSSYSEDRLPSLTEDLLTWLESYAVPVRHGHWSTGPDALMPLDDAATRPNNRLPQPRRRLPRGRHGLPPGAIARSQRTRIIEATAEVMMAQGYAETTVSHIVRAAGISREVFYVYFSNKQHAYLASQQYATQHILETCTTAYFEGRAWPERVWNALRALLGLLARNPELAHLRLVECYPAGPAAIANTEQLKRAATIFLQEGYQQRPAASKLPRLCAHAISGAIFEVFYRQISRGEASELQRYLPQLTYIAIAPYLGPRKAIAAIERLKAAAAIPH
jgi:AcrR family transcriptional regulator